MLVIRKYKLEDRSGNQGIKMPDKVKILGVKRHRDGEMYISALVDEQSQMGNKYFILVLFGDYREDIKRAKFISIVPGHLTWHIFEVV